MSAQPWMKFYPRDWRGDQALRACSVAARGLWMECLCIMHEAKPYGHLLLNGDRVDDDALARMAGVSVDEARSLMAELRKAGVFSLTREGVVYSRRMTKDYGRTQKGAKAAKKRWSQAIENNEENNQPNGSPNGYPNGNPTTQKPEARDQIEEGREKDKRIESEGRREPENPPDEHPPIRPNSDYAFVGKVIRLTWRDFAQWQESYRHIPDLRAKLQSEDDWYSRQPERGRKNWFVRVSNKLKKDNDGYAQQSGRGANNVVDLSSMTARERLMNCNIA